MKGRLRIPSADPSDLFEDAFFNLTDPHSGQAVDLSDLLQGVRTVLRSKDDAVVTFGVGDPVLAPLPLAIRTVLGVCRETRRAVHNLITTFILYDHKPSFTVLHRCLSV